MTESSVASLMRDYLNEEHNLYTNNWCTRIKSAKFLHKKNN